DGEDLVQYLLLEDVHPVVLDLEEQVFLAADVLVQTGLGEAAGVGDVLDRGPLVALLADDASGGLENRVASPLGVVGRDPRLTPGPAGRDLPLFQRGSSSCESVRADLPSGR